ncbi:MAG: PD40 domain-containing protein [Vicinamibacteria bacterium]|nr:PD40 domain-containing protein [Vicinamibacteria bacterium]
MASPIRRVSDEASGVVGIVSPAHVSPRGEQTPALAPDGERVVFAKKIDGRNPVPLTAACAQDDSEPAISPDGRRIAYRSECAGAGIFVMGATGESARRVSDVGYSPSWSPDGRRIAFWGQGQPASNREVWSVAADGSEVGADRAQRVTEDSAIDWSPAWSPDGAWLYFSSTRGGTMNLWRVGVEAATGRTRGDPEPVVVPSGWVGWPSFARDGRRFAFVDRNMRTAILRAPFDPNRGELTGAPRQVETGSIEVWLDGFDLAPDGSSVLFSTVGMPQHLMTAQAEGRELRQLTEGPDRYRQGRFSPDGSWIALQAARFPASNEIAGQQPTVARPGIGRECQTLRRRRQPT